MKKFAILALAALLVVAFTMPAAALENEFGGYWRARFHTDGSFSGQDRGDLLAPGVFAGDDNYRRADTRTRLYYTAKINDNLKFVNKFEYDATFGSAAGSRSAAGAGNRGYGQVSADGANIEIKNSYADFTVGPVNFTVGVQGYSLFRDFHISDDASGIIARYKVLDNFVLAGSWLKAFEGGNGGGNNDDLDAYTLTGAFYFSENMSIKPSFSYAKSSEGAAYLGTFGAALAALPVNPLTLAGLGGKVDLYTFGFDFDASFDNFGVWATVYGQRGTAESQSGLTSDLDFKGWLAAIGGNVDLGMFDIHGQAIYTPGDDDRLDSDLEQIFSPNGSYYWSEIMGYGMFDDYASAGSPADKFSNMMAFNLGTTVKPMDKLKIKADLWYAQRDEDLIFADPITGLPVGEKKLGTELDVVVTYELVEGLNMDLVGAYLWADDATSLTGKNEEDPYEFGMRLSLSF